MKKPWRFDVPAETAVVTTTFVTKKRQPILYVTHEMDPEEGVIWQFHTGNNDVRPEVLQLVRLDEILALDPSIHRLADLPIGYAARRAHPSADWVRAPE